jgi:hypothetical protein
MEKEVFKIDSSVKEVVITHKKALDELEPVKIEIAGNIDSPFNFIEKRYDKGLLIDPGRVGFLSHVLINREQMFILLVFNEHDRLYAGKVQGSLAYHPDYEKWKINTGEPWGHQQFAEFCKMNRSCFPDPNVAMRLFQELKNVRIKTDKEYENQNDNRGSVKQMIAQKVIASNIPDKFQIHVPIFKGQPKHTIEVEIYVDPSTFTVSLVSPQAEDIIHVVRDTIIDEQKKLIQEVAPELVIIEQ